MRMSERLKACPFCCGKPNVVYNVTRKALTEHSTVGTLVICGQCRANVFAKTEEAAEHAWNMRVTGEPTTGGGEFKSTEEKDD